MSNQPTDERVIWNLQMKARMQRGLAGVLRASGRDQEADTARARAEWADAEARRLEGKGGR